MPESKEIHFSLPPEYHQAVTAERKAREEAYLDTVAFVQGIPLRQITPRILARLFYMGTPFMGAGTITDSETGRFLWACHQDYIPSQEAANAFTKHLVKQTRKGLFDFTQAALGIDAFLDFTFMDSPGGKSGVSYTSSVAWLEYRMAQEPFCWDYDLKTADTPLRRIYQLIRCQARDDRQTIGNRKSDAIRLAWLDRVNAEIKAMRERGEFGAS